MRMKCIAMFVLALLLCSCSGQESTQVCTTVAWEAGMEDLGEDEIQEIGKSCDSLFHFRTTKDIFMPQWTDWLREHGYEIENIREQSRNIQYQNPRRGYLDLYSSISFDVAGNKNSFSDNTISYDTYSGQIHSLEINGETLEECCEVLELLAATESRLCGDSGFRLYEPDVWFQDPYIIKGKSQETWQNNFSFSGRGYEIDFIDRDGRSTVIANPSFDSDNGRMITREEAEKSGQNCSGLCHFYAGGDDVVMKLQQIAEEAGYTIGEETDASYNYIYTDSPRDGKPLAEEKTCYRSKRLWNLEGEEKQDYTYWLEVDYDTGGHSVHSVSARLRSTDDCYNFVAALFEEDARVSKDTILLKKVEELKDNIINTDYIFSDSVSAEWGQEPNYRIDVTDLTGKGDLFLLNITGYCMQ